MSIFHLSTEYLVLQTLPNTPNRLFYVKIKSSVFDLGQKKTLRTLGPKCLKEMIYKPLMISFSSSVKEKSKMAKFAA